MKDSKPAYRRHDLSDETWALLEAHLPGRKGVSGGIAEDNRRFIDAVFWILRTGAPWRDLPPEYGGWSNTHRRFIRWRDKGIWEKLLEVLIDEQGMKPVIPPRKNRTRQRPYDRHLYKLRHLVENAFLHLKRWRGIATRYARNSASFLAAIQIGCIALWL